MDNVYYEFTALLLTSAVVGTIAVYLRQPLIVAFIVAGLLIGPSAFDWVRSHDQIDLLAQIGVTVLLFVLIGNPLIVMAIMGYMGYRKRTSFMAGLTVAQIPEQICSSIHTRMLPILRPCSSLQNSN